ncbi:MAG: DUF1624 domain-containing protein [Christensenellaceae bacterium]|jgi:uncharacterized membrane protein|nr:DUF1624 domain-containing protein [Christensenellaceae bacterium]
MNKNTLSKRNKWQGRAWELDLLRGICILFVALDHTMYDINGILNGTWSASGIPALVKAVDFASLYWLSPVRDSWRPIIIYIFFIVAGICTSFCRSNFKRALKLAAVALMLTLITYLANVVTKTDGFLIVFGVLHCLASCMLIYSLMNQLLNFITKKNHVLKATILFTLGLLITQLYKVYFVEPVNAGYLSVSENNSFIWGLFFYNQKVWSMTSDYFPIAPYIGWFLIGAAIGVAFYQKRKSLLPALNRKWHFPLTIPGRHSLFVYLGVRVIEMGILALITYLAIGSFNFL